MNYDQMMFFFERLDAHVEQYSNPRLEEQVGNLRKAFERELRTKLLSDEVKAAVRRSREINWDGHLEGTSRSLHQADDV